MTPVFPDLKDQSVLITGGGSGIGAALSEAFLRQGAKVVLVQRSDSSQFVDRMQAETGNCPLFPPCDITDIPRLQACMAEVAEAHGSITVLVNTAVNDKRHKTEEVTEEFWDWSQAINLKAYFSPVRPSSPVCAPQAAGRS